MITEYFSNNQSLLANASIARNIAEVAIKEISGHTPSLELAQVQTRHIKPILGREGNRSMGKRPPRPGPKHIWNYCAHAV